MVTRQIELDDQTNSILEALAQDCDGDAGTALTGLLQAHKAEEAMLDEWEREQGPELARQKHQSERDFAEGRVVTWDSRTLLG